MKTGSRWLTVVLFAMAMAWVESAVVFYLRTMIDRIEPYQANPLPIFGGLGKAELIRELATLVMLATVGILAGKNVKSRLGYFIMAFGIWDIFYYVFLKVLTGWPHSIFDWDILFLVPLPWWGPVWAPVSIALLMISWGTLAQVETASSGSWKNWCIAGVGAALALYVFMADALQTALSGGSLRELLPASFNWFFFCIALILMGWPVFRDAWVILKERSAPQLKICEEAAP